MSLKPGTSVGPYEILSSLGAGGMGEVYRARDPKLDRHVALKILPAEFASSPEHLRRFEQEARAASALNHPNIVSIYDIGQVDAIAWIAMELIEGRDLRAVIAEDRPPLKQILRVASKVAEGLAAAHERGIVHRDLKPENVMISVDGFVKILDFGLAKRIQPMTEFDDTIPHSAPGSVFGTVDYMSPEQASGRGTDFRSDQFSFGTMLFEMVTGRRPFHRETAAETMTAIIREEAPSLSEIEPAVPAALERIIQRCLVKQPQGRYASTRDLLHDLREVRDALTGPTPSGRRSAPHQIDTGPKLRAMLGVGSVAVVLVAFAVFVFNRRSAIPEGVQTLAVLPFRDMSASAPSQGFAHGIAESIAARVASPGLNVLPMERESGSGDPEPAARRRGATLLLEGSIERSGETLRVLYTVRDVREGRQVASDAISGSAGDVFGLVNLVAESIRRTLRVTSPPAQSATGATRLNPSDQRVYLEALGLLQRFRDEAAIDDALARLERLLLNARDSAAVNGLLARGLLLKYGLTREKALVDQAAIYAERAAQLEPTLPDVHTTLGELRRISGRLPEAESEFRRTLALRADDADAYLGLAETYEAMGRGSEAEENYRKAIALRPGWPRAYGTYGRYCFARGRAGEAITLFRKVVEILPEAPRAHSNLGAAYQAAGRYEDALASYQRSIASGPTANGYSNLGVCHYFLGHFREAANAFENAVRLAPSDYLFWANLGDAYRWIPGEGEKAKAAYEKAVRTGRVTIGVNPTDAVVRAIVASSLAKTGELAQARAEIDAALKIDPTNPDVLYQAAIIALLRGDSDAALGWLERALRAGYRSFDAARDPELQPLRSHPRYQQMFAAARTAA